MWGIVILENGVKDLLQPTTRRLESYKSRSRHLSRVIIPPADLM